MSNYIDKSVNVITFAGYTGGGILCDILNLESSQIGPWNNIKNPKHNLGKIDTENWHTGKGFNLDIFYEKIKRNSANIAYKNKKQWVGTHCWPGAFDTTIFDNVLNITTESRMSKIYRFARVFYASLHGQFPDWEHKQDKKTKPKLIENIVEFNQPFERVNKPNVTNMEFEHLVDFNDTFKSIIFQFLDKEYVKHLEKRITVWKELNNFLYDEKLDTIIKLWDEHNL